jgi:hypothetical protein
MTSRIQRNIWQYSIKIAIFANIWQLKLNIKKKIMWKGFFWQYCGFKNLVKISNLWPILFEFTLKNENLQFNFFSIFVGGKVAKFCK